MEKTCKYITDSSKSVWQIYIYTHTQKKREEKCSRGYKGNNSSKKNRIEHRRRQAPAIIFGRIREKENSLSPRIIRVSNKSRSGNRWYVFNDLTSNHNEQVLSANPSSIYGVSLKEIVDCWNSKIDKYSILFFSRLMFR